MYKLKVTHAWTCVYPREYIFYIKIHKSKGVDTKTLGGHIIIIYIRSTPIRIYFLIYLIRILKLKNIFLEIGVMFIVVFIIWIKYDARVQRCNKK